MSSKDTNKDTVWTFSNQNVLLLLDCSDSFLANRPLQPKKEVADYVSRMWFLVPKRFDSLEQAVASWYKFVVRSEHPQEYSWVSGLAESYVIDPQKIWKYETEPDWPLSDKEICNGVDKNGDRINKYGWKDEEKKLFNYFWKIPDAEILRKLSLFSYKRYQLLGEIIHQDADELFKEHSFSFWEYIPGINHSIVADKDIPNRYYIFSDRYSHDIHYHDGIIVQDGNIIDCWGYHSMKGAKLENMRIFNHNSLIETYEKIRNLEAFDSSHVPIMEIQTSIEDNQLYFLQYHRARDAQVYKKPFTLSRDKEEWEVEANFVRWKTESEWIIVDTGSYYYWTYSVKNLHEQASFDFHYNNIFFDCMSQSRIVNFGFKPLGFKSIAWFIVSWHDSMARMFKADMFVNIERSDFEDLGIDFRKIFLLGEALWKPYTIKVRVVSDGKKAYVKVVTPLEQIEKDYQEYVWNEAEYLKKVRNGRVSSQFNVIIKK